MTAADSGIDLSKVDSDVVLYTIVVGFIVAIVVLSILRAGKLQHPMPLIVALSVVTVISIAGYVLTEDAPLATIAATGVGALAGALSATFTAKVEEPTPPSDES
jgi:hypothetical protein